MTTLTSAASTQASMRALQDPRRTCRVPRLQYSMTAHVSISTIDCWSCVCTGAHAFQLADVPLATIIVSERLWIRQISGRAG